MFHLSVVQMVSSVFCEFETSQGDWTLKISVHSEVQKSRVKIKKKKKIRVADHSLSALTFAVKFPHLFFFYAVSFTFVSFLKACLASADALPGLPPQVSNFSEDFAS